MDLPVTLAAIAALAALAVFCGWRGALPPNLLKGPRMIPWRPLMAIFFTGAMLLLVHVATLLKGGG
jgi:hypothetical protein